MKYQITKADYISNPHVSQIVIYATGEGGALYRIALSIAPGQEIPGKRWLYIDDDSAYDHPPDELITQTREIFEKMRSAEMV